MRGRVVGALIGTGLALAAAGFAVGHITGDDVVWRSGIAQVGGDDAAPQFTVVGDGTAWGASASVPMWIDAAGERHADGWPDCMLPPTEQHPDRANQVPVRFATLTTDWGFARGDLVVGVDCR